MARLVVAYGLPDLPWQLSGESLAQIALPNQGYQLGNAYAIVTNPDAPQIGLRTLLVKPGSRGQGQAARLVQALQAAHPQKAWHVPALCPEEFLPFFTKLRFVEGSLAQFQMSVSL